MKYARQNLSWNKWGWKNKSFNLDAKKEALLDFLAQALEVDGIRHTPGVALEDMPLSDVRLSEEQCLALTEILDAERVHCDRFERLFHALGKSYWDVVRLHRGDVPAAPDAVVYPVDAEEIVNLLAFAREHHLAVVPYGGGSSVVGGVEASAGKVAKAVLTLDMTLMRALISIDEVSQMATFQAGIYGPELEDILQERGYTLGHFPQSFEFSTLGGWIAARGSGQQSNRYGAAQKWLCSATLVTPHGVLETSPFPGSSTGPHVNAIIAGSEGAFGVITEATVRIHKLPAVRDYRGFLFKNFELGVHAIRHMIQDETPTAMIRLSDAPETKFFGAFKKLGKESTMTQQVAKQVLSWGGFHSEGQCLMLIGLEGDRDQVLHAQAQSHAACLSQGAIPLGSKTGHDWYSSRFEMPYVRRILMEHGFGVDTMETSTTWANVHHLHEVVAQVLHDAIEQRGVCGMVLTHISHCYKTGASIYFTYVFSRDVEDELAQWQEIKRAASDAIHEHGGTISHHHGVGLDHTPWMQSEKGDVGMALLRAAKRGVDPYGVMNPGKLIPEE